MVLLLLSHFSRVRLCATPQTAATSNYDSGDLIINGKSTKKFSDTDWDAYRNNSIGFVFQSYNLINHLDIISNVEMGMTLSGVPQNEKRKRALESLDKVGLKEHIYKKPTNFRVDKCKELLLQGHLQIIQI